MYADELPTDRRWPMAFMAVRLIHYFHRCPMSQEVLPLGEGHKLINRLLEYTPSIYRDNAVLVHNKSRCLSCGNVVFNPSGNDPVVHRCSSCASDKDNEVILFTVSESKYYNPMLLVLDTLPISVQEHVAKIILDKGYATLYNKQR